MGGLRCRGRVLDDAPAPQLQVGRVTLRFLKPRLAGQAADRLVQRAVGRPALRAALHPGDEALEEFRYVRLPAGDVACRRQAPGVDVVGLKICTQDLLRALGPGRDRLASVEFLDRK